MDPLEKIWLITLPVPNKTVRKRQSYNFPLFRVGLAHDCNVQRVQITCASNITVNEMEKLWLFAPLS